MGRVISEQNKQVIEACREHLMLGDAGDWQAVRMRFPDVPRSTFFRLVELARREIEGSAARTDSPHALKTAQARIRRNIETPEALQRKMRAHLPQAPSPAVVAEMPAETRDRVFDFMAYFHGVVRDAEMMRDKAVRKETDPDTGEVRQVLANPMLMDNSIRRRLQIMDTYLQSMDQLYNLERIQELYKLVIEEVGKADPAVQQQIMVRLRELNNRRGLTVSAQL
jgi:hypothetical protein